MGEDPSIPAGSRIPIYIHYGNATIAGRDSLHDVFLLYEPWDGNAVNQGCLLQVM